jgi:outer membrane protein TolC
VVVGGHVSQACTRRHDRVERDGAAFGCAVGPDFLHPAAPEVGRYTREPTVLRTVSADTKFGRSQRLVNGRDIPADWWRLFHSPALNSLVEKSVVANPNLQATIAALRAAKETVAAQQGKYFPTIDASLNPSCPM